MAVLITTTITTTTSDSLAALTNLSLPPITNSTINHSMC